MVSLRNLVRDFLFFTFYGSEFEAKHVKCSWIHIFVECAKTCRKKLEKYVQCMRKCAF